MMEKINVKQTTRGGEMGRKRPLKITTVIFREKEKSLPSGGQGALFEKTAPWTPAKAFD
jgi:hypothetical protein